MNARGPSCESLTSRLQGRQLSHVVFNDKRRLALHFSGGITLVIDADSSIVKASCLRLLIIAGADVNLVDGARHGRTPLQYAAEFGVLDCLQTLIEAGADINHVDKDGWTALIKNKGFKSLFLLC